jgi:hypothetical protein
VAWLALATLGCGSEELAPPGRLALTVGQEPDTWSRSPAPVTVEVERIREDGTREHLETLAAPAEHVSLGRGRVGSYEVRGLDDSAAARVFGRSLLIEPDGFAGATLPLFVGRSGSFARPPGALLHPPGAGFKAAVLARRYALVAGSTPDGFVQTDGYDLGVWAPLASSPRLSCPADPCRFLSLAIVAETLALGVGDSWGIWFDLISQESGDAPLPTGLAGYADVAGGATLMAPDGSAYIVGATRADDPTAAVLEIAADGTLTALSLTSARAGAAAVWVVGRGLVVAGGSDTGAGIELLAEGSGAFVPLSYPADATAGAALVPIDSASALRVGGRNAAGGAAETAFLALGCGSACAAEPRGAPVALDEASGFSFDGGLGLVVGRASGGETAAFRIDGEGAAEPVPLREPRTGATALRLPTSHVAVVGGVLGDGSPATSIELFAP